MSVYTNCLVSNYAAVRWNGYSRCLEAMDIGGSWSRIDMNSSDNLPSDSAELIEYARTLRARERATESLRAKYPALDKALSQAELIRMICESEENKTTIHPV